MKYWLAPFGLIFSSVVLADGFYIGGDIGRASLDAEESSSVHELDFGNSNTSYGLYAGYRFNLDQYFAAIEVDGTLGKVTVENKVGTASREATRKETYGVYALAGAPITESTDIYGRVGYTKASFKAEGSDGADYSEKEGGWTLGGGAEIDLSDQLQLRLDYRYIDYKKFQFVDGGWDYKVKDQRATIGVNYSF